MAKYAKRLAENLQKLVPLRFPTQTEFARAAGITQPQANQYMTGKAAPKLDNLEGMAAALGLSIAALVGDEVPNLPPQAPLDLELMKLRAISGILTLNSREDLESILDALEPFLNRPGKKNQRRATSP